MKLPKFTVVDKYCKDEMFPNQGLSVETISYLGD